MQETATKTKYPLEYAIRPDNGNYRMAWKRLEHLSEKLNRLWKTKKNSLKILREERAS